MKTISLLFASLFLLSLFPESLLAQRGSFVETNDYRRFEISVGGGQTQGYNDYQLRGEGHPDIHYIAPRDINTTIGLTWYHRKRWFTSLHAHVFNSYSGVSARAKVPPIGNTENNFRTRLKVMTLPFNDYSLRLGRTQFWGNSPWQTRWMVGANIKHIAYEPTIGSINESNNTFLNIKRELRLLTDKSVTSSLQAGCQLAYRGKRMGLSFMLLGNFGLNYISATDYRIWINHQEYNATIRTKDDLIAWIVQYEVYFGNTSSRK
ncbi:MAG: hypothetical protein AAGI23_18300 [Bacteroidota bacterium]